MLSRLKLDFIDIHDNAHRSQDRLQAAAVKGDLEVKTETVLAPSGLLYVAEFVTLLSAAGLLSKHVLLVPEPVVPLLLVCVAEVAAVRKAHTTAQASSYW